jgi:uncharacterized protein YjbJ (UPF0337 family)
MAVAIHSVAQRNLNIGEDERIMGAPNNDEVEGKYEQMKGSVKEGLGKITGDDDMRSEGAADKLKGDVQEGWGGTKRKVGDMLDHAGDAVNK